MRILTRLNPLLAPINRRLIGSPKPEMEVLQPEETALVSPPACLPGMLDRVTATDEHSRLSDQLATATETQVTHVPVLRYTYRNALVSRSGFATARHSEKYTNDLLRAGVSGCLKVTPKLHYCQTYVSWRYFGHWLTDSLPTALIEPGDGALWIPPHPSWGHAQDYKDALALETVDARLVLAEELSVYQDYGQGSHKRARFATILKALHAKFGGDDATETVFIRRGMTGVARVLTNEDALAEALEARGWRILVVATASVGDLQTTLCRARVVVSIDGSHLDHAHLTLLPGSVMVVLIPNDRFTVRQVGLSRAHKVSPGFVVLNGNLSDGYQGDLDEILKTVDLAESAVPP